MQVPLPPRVLADDATPRRRSACWPATGESPSSAPRAACSTWWPAATPAPGSAILGRLPQRPRRRPHPGRPPRQRARVRRTASAHGRPGGPTRRAPHHRRPARLPRPGSAGPGSCTPRPAAPSAAARPARPRSPRPSATTTRPRCGRCAPPSPSSASPPCWCSTPRLSGSCWTSRPTLSPAGRGRRPGPTPGTAGGTRLPALRRPRPDRSPRVPPRSRMPHHLAGDLSPVAPRRMSAAPLREACIYGRLTQPASPYISVRPRQRHGPAAHGVLVASEGQYTGSDHCSLPATVRQ